MKFLRFGKGKEHGEKLNKNASLETRSALEREREREREVNFRCGKFWN